jgi:hypothetical protein
MGLDLTAAPARMGGNCVRFFAVLRGKPTQSTRYSELNGGNSDLWGEPLIFF